MLDLRCCHVQWHCSEITELSACARVWNGRNFKTEFAIQRLCLEALMQIEICFRISRNASDLSSYFYMRDILWRFQATCPLTFACAHHDVFKRLVPLLLHAHQTYWNFSYPLGYFCMNVLCTVPCRVGSSPSRRDREAHSQCIILVGHQSHPPYMLEYLP